ncbi:ATP-binding protein [Thermodesulfatator autotrophicus]|uniref:histidine kinase n=1 Tax=Thermodesulfatator autotrophicus TaxID=1795632 RepID=A0A177E5J9_9BACT|nr:ATP-binding protein [Thermodesulfatator autotrophicus]OAG27214.1 hypothetical protein TH606_08005 [Thermodesulfatator autotrophicus]
MAFPDLSLQNIDFCFPPAWQKVVDFLKTGIVIMSEEGDILFHNKDASDLLGVDSKSLRLKNLSFFLSPDDQKILWPNILGLLEQEGFYVGEIFLIPQNGQPFIAQTQFLKCSENGVSFIVVTFQNIEYLKKLAKSLKEARHFTFLGRMLADMAHHVRNPILVIGGLARRLKNSPEKLTYYSSAIIYQCERLEELLAGLEKVINFPKPRIRLVEVQEIIETLKEVFKGEVSGASPELVINDKNIRNFVFYSDPELLLEALKEILKNALEAHFLCSHEGAVSLNIFKHHQKVFFEVCDQGRGLKPDILPFIFNPFFTTKPGHLGMGLTLASHIVEELGGRIEIANLVNPTIFRLSLPFDRRRPERRALPKHSF